MSVVVSLVVTDLLFTSHSVGSTACCLVALNQAQLSTPSNKDVWKLSMTLFDQRLVCDWLLPREVLWVEVQCLLWLIWVQIAFECFVLTEKKKNDIHFDLKRKEMQQEKKRSEKRKFQERETRITKNYSQSDSMVPVLATYTFGLAVYVRNRHCGLEIICLPSVIRIDEISPDLWLWTWKILH